MLSWDLAVLGFYDNIGCRFSHSLTATEFLASLFFLYTTHTKFSPMKSSDIYGFVIPYISLFVMDLFILYLEVCTL